MRMELLTWRELYWSPDVYLSIWDTCAFHDSSGDSFPSQDAANLLLWLDNSLVFLFQWFLPFLVFLKKDNELDFGDSFFLV